MSLNNMKRRLNYAGGASQQARMNVDKLKSLKGALLHSYQAATIVLSDGRAFRGLINPNKLSMDLDDKELSIPFRDRRLDLPADEAGFDATIDEGIWEELSDIETTLGAWDEMVPLAAIAVEAPEQEIQLPLLPNIHIDRGEENIGVAEGDVIRWRENGTYWLVLMRYLEETAYFRARIYRCRHMVKLQNGNTYWAYIRGPVEQNIDWQQVSGNYFNKLNYSLIMRIGLNDDTIEHFKRFARISIDGKPWEVQAVDRLSTPGILTIALKETFSNPIEEDAAAVVKKLEERLEDTTDRKPYTYIAGPTTVYPYDTRTFTIENHIDIAGSWRVLNESKANIVKIIEQNQNQVTVQILTGKTGSFTLEYFTKYESIATLDVTIASL